MTADVQNREEMTTSIDGIPMCAPNHAELLASLNSDAEYRQPRLFAIYGIYKEVGEFPEEPFLVWGIESVDAGAIVWCPDEKCVHTSDSAERILASYRPRGEARLRWLD
jgi:hypothetical protein